MTDQDQQVLIDAEIVAELEGVIVTLASIARGQAASEARSPTSRHLRNLGQRLIDLAEAEDRDWLARAQLRIDDRKREEEFAAEQMNLIPERS